MLITIPGRPVPAVRMTQKDKWKDSAKKYLTYKSVIGIIARQQCKFPTQQSVAVIVRAYLKGKTTLMGMDGDVDNYLKSALDGMNKIVFADDRQVIQAVVLKLPCQSEVEQRMEIEVSIMEESGRGITNVL